MRVWTTTSVCRHCLCVCVLCVRYMWVCAGVRVCAFVCWNPTIQVFLFFCFALFAAAVAAAVLIMSVSRRPSTSQDLYFVVATVQQQSHVKLFLLRRPRTVRQFVCVYVLCFLCGRTNNIKRGGKILQRGQGDINPHLIPRDFKSNRAATVTTAAVQQHYNNTSASSSGLRDSHDALVFIHVCSVQEIFVHAGNHYHIYLFLRQTHVVELILPYSMYTRYSTGLLAIRNRKQVQAGFLN